MKLLRLCLPVALRSAVLGTGLLVLAAGCSTLPPPRSVAPPPSSVARTDTAINSNSATSALPADWSTRAIAAARAVLSSCVRATSLRPDGCPQHYEKQFVGDVLSATWTLLDPPLQDAVALPPQGGQGDFLRTVSVYGRYQMSVSFTTPGQSIRPYLGYAGGIAEATMTWDGQSFQNVNMGDANSAPPETGLGPFSRPADASDAAALQAVKSAFHDCVTVSVTAAAATPPNCPNNGPSLDAYYADLRWSLTRDPMQGALVTFDTDQGKFLVTGSVSMALTVQHRLPSEAPTSRTFPTAGNYTATLAWDGHQIIVLTMTLA